MRRQVLEIASLAAVSLFSAGCFTQEETIVVRPDGSASVSLKLEGTPAELAAREATPATRGWSRTVADRPAPDSEGKVEVGWEATLSHLNNYPVSFAPPGHPHAGVFPVSDTRLEIDRQPGRTVYTFTRRYIGRRSGRFRALQEESGSKNLLARAEDSGFGSLTAEEQQQLFAALAEYEAAAIWLRTRDALGRAVLEGLLDAATYSDAVTRTADYLQERITGDYLEQFLATSEDEQASELARLRTGLREEVERLLPAAGLERTLFLIEDEEKAFAVTEDLHDDNFLLEVTLPGTVVGGNAFMVDAGTVVWEFNGGDFAEGDLVLTAVSVLEHGGRGRR